MSWLVIFRSFCSSTLIKSLVHSHSLSTPLSLSLSFTFPGCTLVYGRCHHIRRCGWDFMLDKTMQVNMATALGGGNAEDKKNNWNATVVEIIEQENAAC